MMDLQSLSIASLRERWSCSKKFIDDRIKRGELIAMRLGPRTTRIPIAQVLEYERKCLTNGEGASTVASGAASSDLDQAAAVARSIRSVVGLAYFFHAAT